MPPSLSDGRWWYHINPQSFSQFIQLELSRDASVMSYKSPTVSPDSYQVRVVSGCLHLFQQIPNPTFPALIQLELSRDASVSFRWWCYINPQQFLPALILIQLELSRDASVSFRWWCHINRQQFLPALIQLELSRNATEYSRSWCHWFSYLAGMSPYISLKIKKRHYEHHMIEAHKYLITWISDDFFFFF